MSLGALVPRAPLTFKPQKQVKRRRHAQNVANSQPKKEKRHDKVAGVFHSHKRRLWANAEYMGLEIALRVASGRLPHPRKLTEKS